MDFEPEDATEVALATLCVDDHVSTAAHGLEAIARDRLSAATNDLAGIASSAVPSVQDRLFEVMTELDDLAYELRAIIVALRSGHER